MHQINECVLSKLKDKHPPASEANCKVQMEITKDPPVPVIFEEISAELVQKVTKQIQGSGGPTKVDADFFKHILCSKFYGKKSENLCIAVADLTKRLATERLEPQCLRHFLSCRLIPLEKDSSTESNIQIRPIGIGDVLRRITGKCITTVLRKDTQEAAGILQTCSGVSCAIEAAIHATRKAFSDEECEAVLLIDASNAFNCLNRATAIHNMRELCPPLHQYIENTYQTAVDLIINNPNGDDEYLKSAEGATQGDVAAMQMYGISMRPLIDSLGEGTDPQNARQAWYADDATATGTLEELLKWWNLLCELGPYYGYYPNSSKTVLILKSDSLTDKANEFFGKTGVKITSEGERHLGAVIGTTTFKENYVKDKVQKWVADVENLTEIARDEPQAAYIAYTRGLCHRWTFLQRTVKDVSQLFIPLEQAIFDKLLPAIVGRTLSNHEKRLLELPVRYGGLGIKNPRTCADKEYKNSHYVTEELTELIYHQNRSSYANLKHIETKKKILRDCKEVHLKKEFIDICESKKTSHHLKRLMLLAREKGAGGWLTALPIQSLGYALNKEDFRGSLCIRYGWRVRNMPSYCVCGADNSINHSLVCKTGGYTIFRHNIVRDAIAEILRETCKDVVIEPELIPIDSDYNLNSSGNIAEKARLDVSSVGLWSPLEKNFMDIRVFHPNALSYENRSLEALYKDHERQKKAAYSSRVNQIEKSSFTPMVFTTFGGMGDECRRALQRAAGKIASKRKENYADVMGHISTRIRMCILRTVLMSVRGSRGTSKGTSKPISSVSFNLIPGIEDLKDIEN